MGDVHGDGNTYTSMLDDGAIDPQCSDCHATVPANSYHNIHSASVDCSTCHMQSVVTCYNCHFETELDLDAKKAFRQFKDWKFLLNYRGKVYPANFQSVKYGDNTFLVFAPFYSHTIARDAVTGCNDCHGNAAVTEWFDDADNVIDVMVWDDVNSQFDQLQGVIPIPPDYVTKMRFDFVDLDQPGGTVWSFLETGPDQFQMVFGEPLTQAQMDKIKDNR
jgi:hypothetical protein